MEATNTHPEGARPQAGRTGEGWTALRRRARGKRWDKIALVFLAPWLIQLCIFTLYPLFIALYGSVADWNILTGEMKYVGFVQLCRIVE